MSNTDRVDDDFTREIEAYLETAKNLMTENGKVIAMVFMEAGSRVNVLPIDSYPYSAQPHVLAILSRVDPAITRAFHIAEAWTAQYDTPVMTRMPRDREDRAECVIVCAKDRRLGIRMLRLIYERNMDSGAIEWPHAPEWMVGSGVSSRLLNGLWEISDADVHAGSLNS